MTPSAIRALREQVEAGEWQPHDVAGAMYDLGGDFTRHRTLARDAYSGSLDAAMALHEALLQGWTRAVDATLPEAGIEVTLYPPCCPLSDGYRGPCRGDGAIESRAHLIAILRALEEEAKG